ncbi:MAG: T9SS type A sorting domain-containing protein [Salinibacter sp.]|uniref:T9SS type A sorting domain-containing protein n=1 Tax=Salinibacter sp. TaxID=2065818 RepID=UPI0035D51E51
MKNAVGLFALLVGLALVASSQVRAGDPEHEDRFGERTALYIWSDALQSQSISSIVDLAETQNIERLILSVGQGSPIEKVKALKAQARKSGIATEFLLAPNYWVRSGEPEDVRSRVNGIDLQGSTLHINIEPHAYDDFDQRTAEYLRRYLEVLRVVRESIGDSKLAVSVPVWWPDSTYRKMAPIVDRAYLMAYGEKEPRERAEQTREAARHFSPEQRAVALRPEDYPSPSVLNQTVQAVGDIVGTDQFALHDFESFVEFIGGTNELPVELGHFDGTAVETSVRLAWQTVSETNNAGFEVQRQDDEDGWTQIGYVRSKASGGTTTQALSYRFETGELPVGKHQFRLRQVHLNGASTLSDSVTVRVQMQEALRLSAPAPNPTRSGATLRFGTKEAEHAELALYDALGRRVRTLFQGRSGGGRMQTVRLRAGSLSAGTYFLRLRAGGQARTRRVTIVQ